MKTIADFKRRMVKGAKVNSSLYHKNRDGEEYQVNDLKDRTCTVSQSNSFACSIPETDRSSWCEWPKKEEFRVIDENTVEIKSSFSRLIYQFI